MAKIDGAQTIPSELFYQYAALLTPKLSGAQIRTRTPFTRPDSRAGGPDESAAQITQRDRFRAAMQNFAALTPTERAAWYDAMPQWHSLLWYYNYFVMSSLAGNADITQGGSGVIKTIQNQKASVPTTGTKVFTLVTTVDATKTVVMIQGSARKVPRVIRGSGSVATGGATLNLGATVDPAKCTVELNGASFIQQTADGFIQVLPYISSLSATQIGIAWALTPDLAATVSFEVTEHIEGSVQPVIVAVSNTQVTIDWAEIPDAAADASITVIEYI